MSKFTNAELDESRKMIDKALATLKDVGLDAKTSGGLTYGDTFFTCKIQVTKVGELTKEQTLYDMYSPRYRLPKRETVVELNGDIFKIHGWNSRARKNKVILTKVNNGKNYCGSVDQIKFAVVQ